MSGAELRRLRRKAGLTQAALGERLGVHTNSVARYERDEVGIPEPVARLARLLLGAKAAPSRRK